MNQNNINSDPGSIRVEEQQDMQQLVDMFCRSMARAAAEEQRRSDEEKAALKKKKEPVTIDLVELFFRIVENLKYVVIIAVLGAILGGVYAEKSLVPYYSATAKLYVLGENDATINLSSLQVGSQLTLDYREVFRTWEVHEMVRQSLGLNYSYSQLQSMLTISNPEDTRVLYINVLNTDAQLATDIANAYATAAKQFILETMDTEEPNVFSVALVPSNAIVKSNRTYILMGFMLGTILALGMIVLLFVLDDRPHSPEDISRYVDVPTFAVVPSMGKKHKHDQLT